MYQLQKHGIKFQKQQVNMARVKVINGKPVVFNKLPEVWQGINGHYLNFDKMDFYTKKADQIVVKEMKIPSRLLEHVAQRIIERIKSTVKNLDHIRVRVSKINPPIGGDVQSVSVLLEV